MFNIGFSELIIVLLIAFLVVGPKDLPRVARWLGRSVKKLRQMIQEVKKETGWADLEKEYKDTKNDVDKAVKDLKNDLDVTKELKGAADDVNKSVKSVADELHAAGKDIACVPGDNGGYTMHLGTTEIILIVVLALVLFGGGKLAGVGKALGKSIKDFKHEVKDDEKPEEAKDEEKKS